MFRYQVDNEITLELQSPEQGKVLFPLVSANRDFIGAYLSWANRVDTIEDMQDYLQRDLQGMSNARRWGWLILYQGQPVGRIGIFVSLPDLRESEVHYWLAEDFTGKGIITRAAKTIVNYAFNELNLNHVLIGFSSENRKSGAVAERLGFKYETMLRDCNVHEGIREQLHLWGILADEWKTESQPIFSYPIDETIHLRLQELHHVSSQYELIQKNLPELQEWFWWANKHSIEQERNYTEKMLKKYAAGTGFMLGIWDKNTLIGSLALHINKRKRSAEIGYWLDKEATGKGIMTRAVKSLMRYAFEVRGLERFYLRAATANRASQAIAERLGLQQDAILRECELVEGQYHDLVYYSMLKHEWTGL